MLQEAPGARAPVVPSFVTPVVRHSRKHRHTRPSRNERNRRGQVHQVALRLRLRSRGGRLGGVSPRLSCSQRTMRGPCSSSALRARRVTGGPIRRPAHSDRGRAAGRLVLARHPRRDEAAVRRHILKRQACVGRRDRVRPRVRVRLAQGWRERQRPERGFVGADIRLLVDAPEKASIGAGNVPAGLRRSQPSEHSQYRRGDDCPTLHGLKIGIRSVALKRRVAYPSRRTFGVVSTSSSRPSGTSRAAPRNSSSARHRATYCVPSGSTTGTSSRP